MHMSTLHITLAATLLVGTTAIATAADGGDVTPPPHGRAIHGRFVGEALSGPECTSPVNVCTKGHVSGSIEGEFVFTVTALIPNADTSQTGVLNYTGEGVVTTRHGLIFFKDTGAIDVTPGDPGDIGSVSTITGGTGRYLGASGRFHVAGTSTAADGSESEYSGVLQLAH
jgi:hypothetical protein